jgi:hypothetical protein
LQTQDHPGESRSQKNNEQGPATDEIDFIQKTTKPVRRKQGQPQGLAQKQYGSTSFPG